MRKWIYIKSGKREEVNKMKLINKLNITIIILLAIGFIYRLFLSSFAQTGNFWDMANYYYYAKSFLGGQIFSDCCLKNVGYGAFLAGIYRIFGFDNYQAVRITQIILDLTIAILVYFTSKNIFNKKTALFSFILYILNPLTSSYTGFRLPEIISILYITGIVFLLSLKSFKSNRVIWLLFGILLGLTLFTRMQFLYFSFFILIAFTAHFKQKKIKILFFLISVSGFLIASSYSLYSNYRNFNKISLTPPYTSKYLNIYSNFYNTMRYSEIITDYIKVDPKYSEIINEYFIALDYNDLTKVIKVDEKYKVLFFEKIKTDWPIFLKNTMQNLVWLWDKDHLFAYADPFYPADIIPIRIMNIFLLALFIIGIIAFIIQRRTKIFRNPVMIFSVLFFLYLSTAVPLVSNESRHVMIYYSIIMLWAGYGIYTFFHIFYRKRKVRTEDKIL
jgi:4-amino-4-deoxy-L-arabinose transferase-like glycosyltransferase